MRWLLTYPEDGPSVPHYRKWVEACGAEPTLVDPNYRWAGDASPFDALLLPGGGDVDPALYGEAVRHCATYGVQAARDALERQLIHDFAERGKPIFGICRGIQILNVVLGGGLLQHVPDWVDEARERHERQEQYDAYHALVPLSETRLGAALAGVAETNSAHHQAVDPARLGAGLMVAARSGAGVIEAVESVDPARRISAVQWHPERLRSEHPASALLRAHWRAMALID